jgi:cytidylate kinase
MKITICGKGGSGKSAVAKALAKEFHLKHYSTGDFMRKIATEKGYTIEQWSHVTPVEIDNMIDKWAENVGKTEDNFIFDSRLAFHFIPEAIKIYLDVSYEEAARRVFANPRSTEAKVNSVEELAQRNKIRWETDRERYKKIYNIDVDDKINYDAYIDTTGKSIKEVINEIKRIIKSLSKK